MCKNLYSNSVKLCMLLADARLSDVPTHW